MLLFYGFLSGILGWVTSARWDDSSADQWKNWLFVLHIVWTSTCYLLILLSNFAATTVFYMYSKAIHGELAWEIAQEFATEYVSLPFDDGKVPHVVSVVYG
ncbi:hypothetical protein COLO4_27958 [Corchorus olitorius]|uniref:Uncharacterized protein n=1 Tax=Corchorus olitorius TaxID=93759 RepID=A0A1R3HNV7_9ROSI|nr:hypothetical protein COLO4_27958 [Corchorus olitorius]